jgi:hypothetical protein
LSCLATSARGVAGPAASLLITARVSEPLEAVEDEIQPELELGRHPPFLDLGAVYLSTLALVQRARRIERFS